MMKSVPSFLGRALTLSLVLHAALIFASAQFIVPASWTERPARPELKVSLREPAVTPGAPVAPGPEFFLPREVPRKSGAEALSRASRPGPTVAGPQVLQGEAALLATEQLRRELPYPPEAIERGLQGEALVLLFLDPSGNAIAARLEASSGHALLDDAAVRAARSLHSLPASAPREALLPVRFRLR